MTINTDSSSALSRTGSPNAGGNQQRFTRQPDNSAPPDQDSVTLSAPILAGLGMNSNSAERVAALKLQYENGTYQPSSQELAGKILDIHL